jgi:transcriptional regulator with XRE-family HTH domain
MEPRQCRAARGLLDLSQADLARRAGVGLGTVIAYEAGSRGTHAANVARIKTAMEASGAIFKNDGSLVAADTVLDQFTKLERPTSAQRAEATVAAHRVAQAGGRRPAMSEGAAAIVKAYEKSLGIRKDEQT